MAYIDISKDFLIEVAKGNVEGHSLIHKFGSNTGVGTTIEPITTAGVYQTPTAAVALEIISDDGNDTLLGTGARSVTIEGLDSSGDFQTEDINMNGLAANALANTYLRVYRMYVKNSGSYASASVSSHAGNITLRVAAAGATWAQILMTGAGFGLGQSQIGVYSVPGGFTAYLLSMSYSVDSNKTVDLYLFKRENLTDVSVPYSPMRLQGLQEGITGAAQFQQFAIQSYLEGTDLGFMASVSSGSASVSVEFELLLVAN